MRRAMLTAMVCAGTTTTGLAQVMWVGSTGDWFDAANWDGGVVPTGGAVIGNGGTAIVDGTAVSIGGFGAGFNGTGSLRVLDGQFTAGAMSVGRFDGDDGSFLFQGSQTRITADTLAIAVLGRGSAEVRDGAAVEADRLSIGFIPNNDAATAEGRLVISGAGSVVRATGPDDSRLGENGSANILIEDGGRLELRTALLVTRSARDSTLEIRGEGSQMTLEPAAPRPGSGFGYTFDVGQYVLGTFDDGAGNVDVTVSDGARLTMQRDTSVPSASQDRYAMRLFRGATLRGNNGTVDADIRLVQGARIAPGDHGAGTLTINGFVYAGEDLEPIRGTIAMELGGNIAGDEFDQLILRPSVALPDVQLIDADFDDTVVELLDAQRLELEVSLINNFTPTLGDRFDLILFEPIVGEDNPLWTEFGAFDLAPLTGNLFFEVEYASTGVSLVVVPTPSAAAVLGLASLAITRRRRA